MSIDAKLANACATADLTGSSTGVRPVTWGERDTMLYALGVGAGLGAPDREMGFTTENSKGFTLRALPSFLTIITAGVRPPALDTLDVSRSLHVGQGITLVRPLPASGQAMLRATIETMVDKGNSAIITTASTLSEDEAGERVIGHARTSLLVPGAGGSGGPRGTTDAYVLPDRAPDARISHRTRPEQALLYRLSGDRHRLHSDPAFARELGFDRPILHGLCTYGFACRAIVEGMAGGDPDRLRAMDGRFRRPVYPGDALTTEMWRISDDEILFRTLNGTGDVVFERGQATVDV